MADLTSMTDGMMISNDPNKIITFTAKEMLDNGAFNTNNIMASVYEVRTISGGILSVPLIKISNNDSAERNIVKYINNTNFIIYSNNTDTGILDYYNITTIISIIPNPKDHVFIKYRGLDGSIKILSYNDSLQKRIMNKKYSIRESDILAYGIVPCLREIAVEIFRYFLSFNNRNYQEDFDLIYLSYSNSNNHLISIDLVNIFDFESTLMNIYDSKINTVNMGIDIIIFDIFNINEQEKARELYEFMYNRFNKGNILQDVIDFYNTNPYRSSGKIDLGELNDIKLD